MANQEIEGIARRLRYEATMHLRGNDNIGKALRFFSVRETGFEQRVGEFEDVCSLLNSLIAGQEDIDPTLYKNVIELKDMLGSHGPPRTLGESIGICEELREEEDYMETNNVANAFEAIKKKIVSEEWEFVRQITDDPTKLASALLIEGYGIFTEKLMNKPEDSGMARTVVLAFEEVLFTNYPNSVILQDVVEWMKEEKADFGPEIVRRLENMQ